MREFQAKLTERFLELLNIEMRVNVLVDIIDQEEFISKETILRILGTEKAIEVADCIHEKDKELFKEMPED